MPILAQARGQPFSWQGEGHPYELLTRSPWMIIGGKGNVTMVTEESFVGEHTPRVLLAGDGSRRGIMQERLGLVAGKQYVGRVILAGQAAAVTIEISLVWGSGSSDRETVVGCNGKAIFFQKKGDRPYAGGEGLLG